MHNELATKDVLADPPKSEFGQLILALANDIDTEKFKELLQLKREQDEIERKLRAQEAYLEAKAAFLGECPVITSDKKGGGGGGPKWNYPSYGRILSVALPIMSKFGLSHTTTPDFENERVTCVMKHTLGHEESAMFPMTLEGQNERATSSLTLQQKWALALTFAERQSFKAVSGVPTSDDDVDKLPIGEAQKQTEAQQSHTAVAAKIKKDWLSPRHELHDQSQAEKHRRFGAWFLSHTDAKTFSPVVDRWTPEQLIQCREQLDKEAQASQYAASEPPANPLTTHQGEEAYD